MIQEIGTKFLVSEEHNYLQRMELISDTVFVHFINTFSLYSQKNKFMHRNLLCNKVFLRLLQQHMYHSVEIAEFHS